MMNYVDDLLSVALGHKGVTTRARSVVMRPITPRVQHARQAAVWRASYPPRLLDWHPGHGSIDRNKAVHASIKVSVDEAVLGQEPAHARLPPISTPTRPLYENPGAHAESVISNLLKGTPDPPEQLPM